MACDHYVDDTGTKMQVAFVDCSSNIVDISNASTKRITLKKPNGITTDYSGVFETDGTDGLLNYFLVAGDFDIAGDWDIQGFAILPAGEWSTSTGDFVVKDNL